MADTTLLADDLVSGAATKLAATAVKCLAVAGGALIGYFAGWVLAWVLDKWVFASKAPRVVHKVFRLLFAVALAVLVALVVFGSGGAGLFGGGGSGDGKGGGPPADDKGKGEKKPPDPPKEEPKVVLPKVEPKTPVKATPSDVRVAILSGTDVTAGKFYVLDDDPTPRTLAELKDAILAKRAASKTELTVVFRFLREPLSDTHPAVRQAVGWVNEVKLLNRFE
ncbi:MAG: hypothetical protein K2V38_05850 [Gemmataceae bacterium]|nr:hypothetical protein [Gemmataceae bacterium]